MTQSLVNLAWKLSQADDLPRALDYAHRATLLEPESPEAQKLMGDLLWEVGQKEEAKQRYTTFLKLHPPYLRDRERVKSRLER